MNQRAIGFCAALALTSVVPGAIAEERGPMVANSQPASRTDTVKAYGTLPIRFEPNVGQAPLPLEYVARGTGYTVGIDQREFVLSLRQPTSSATGTQSSDSRTPRPLLPPATLRLRPIHAETTKPQLRAERQQQSVSNYFIGNDPSKWRADVPNYAAVRYEQIYPGIDWVLYGNPRQLEYDFVVAPRADPRRIELGIQGADALTLDDNGDLKVNVHGVTLRQLKPVIYQAAADGTRHEIDGHYVLTRHRHVTFALGDYDRTRELIIDPTFVYSTYLGGSGLDQATAIAVDSAGSAYVAGTTSSKDFPTAQPLQGSSRETGFATAFIAKFNAAGTALVYSTYLGGSGSNRTGNLGYCGPVSSDNFGRGALLVGNGGDAATAIAIDAAGNAYIAGVTSSSDFPTVAPFQATNHAAVNQGSNAFLAKLNPAGNALVYSTYLGGSGVAGALITGDSAAGIAVDATGAAYVTGITLSQDFPTLTPFQATNEQRSGSPTGFVSKFNAAGNALAYSTYLGGSGSGASSGSTGTGAEIGDCANAIAVDASGNAYIAGQTSSADFPTEAPYQSVNRSLASTIVINPGSAFVTKLNPSGSALIYSTYLGGSVGDAALGVAADSSGDAYITGFTWSTDFPTANALQPQNAAGATHGANAFVTKLNPAGSELIYSTYLGGSTDDQANAIALDASGDAYITGSTYSSDFPTVNPVQATNLAASRNANNAFIAVINPTGSVLAFSTYLGGSGTEGFLSCPVGVTPCGPVYNGDIAAAIAVDNSANAYVTGLANSSDFPMAMAFQTRPASIFVTKVLVAPLGETLVTEPAPATPHGGSGALGWGAISILGLALATRRRKPH
jgi:hypothetical protein